MLESLQLTEFEFDFHVTSVGWATIHLGPGLPDESRNFRVSYLSDALGEFVTAVIDTCSTVENVSACVVWLSEPEEVCCRIKRGDQGMIALDISWRADGDAVWVPVGTIQSNAETVARTVVAACDRIDRSSYEVNWSEFPFPTEGITRLRTSCPW